VSRFPLPNLLGELVAIPSANPPGREEDVTRYIAGILQGQGILSRSIPLEEGRTSLYAEIPGKEPGSLILSGHLDTVPPTSSWSTPPYQVVEKDGFLYGLGTVDMKGGVAMLVEAFCQVARAGQPRHTLKLLLAADEEGNLGGAKSFQREGLANDAIFALVAEATAGRVMVGERGLFWPRVFFMGKETHGSTPEKGINAIEAACLMIPPLLGWVRSQPAIELFGPPTLNVGCIEGGRQPNIVAERCQVDLDFRYGKEQERETMVECMETLATQSLPRIGFHWETLRSMRPMYTSPTHPWVQALCTAEREVRGVSGLPGVVSYCTDLPALFPIHYPPFVVFGPGDISQAHQPDERLPIASLEECSLVLQQFLTHILS
jgi:succinyl-diaminopimelate desuccinylase